MLNIKTFSFTNYKAIRLALGVSLLFFMSQIYIPTTPVPITFQTVGGILIGLLFSPKESINIWCTYFIMGVIGIPVFFGFSSGAEKFVGPTAGYLIGMALSSVVISYIIKTFAINIKNTLNLFLLSLAGQITVYIFGVSWLSYLITFEKAIYSGFIVFIPSGIAKTLALTFIFKKVNEKYN